MKDFECPACGEKIPHDSIYCDMCGAELLECVKCHTPGTDPFCPECGSPMISRKPGSTPEKQGKLVLKSRKGNTVIVPAHEAVIGRENSPYAAELASFGLISRRHGKFVKQGDEWFIVDFNSTNGTYVNDREVPGNTPVKIAAGDTVDIGTYIFDAVEE